MLEELVRALIVGAKADPELHAMVTSACRGVLTILEPPPPPSPNEAPATPPEAKPAEAVPVPETKPPSPSVFDRVIANLHAELDARGVARPRVSPGVRMPFLDVEPGPGP